VSSCHEELIPKIGIVTDVRRDTPDVKTFRVVTPDGRKPFEHIPGQCAMISIPGVGEGMFSITSSPTVESYMEFSIKKAGHLTSFIHELEPGSMITIRGPYGNGFPVDTELKGKSLLFVAGGIGLAPLHSVIDYCLAKRADYGEIEVVYGSRSKDDLVDIQEIRDSWEKADNFKMHLTIDRPQEGWDGHVGFVPNYVKEVNPSLDKVALICGPPIMIKFTLQNMMDLGFARNQVYTTLELRMKCGIGKCGRCNVGSKYVCKDGPVFRFDQLDELPDEY
jgi:NAD(P)H-flavin reductase